MVIGHDGGWHKTAAMRERPNSTSYQPRLPNSGNSELTASELLGTWNQRTEDSKDSSNLLIEAEKARETAGLHTVRNALRKKSKNGLSTTGTDKRMLVGNKRTSTK